MAPWLLAIAVGVPAALALLGLLALLARRAERAAGVRDLRERFARLGYRDRVAVAVAVTRDRRVPWRARAIPPALLAYLLLPFDLVPDFIPVLGQLDDVLVLALGLWLLLRWTPRAVIEEQIARRERGPQAPGAGDRRSRR